MDSSSLIYDKYVVEYIDAQGSSFMAKRRHYPLFKALNLFIELSRAGSVGEALEKARDSSSLYKVLQAFIGRLESEGLKPKTVLYYLSILASFLRFHNVDYQNSLRKIKKPKKAPVRVDKIPSIADLQKMILSTKSRRLALLIQLLAQTGMRLNEALNMKIEYIDFENNIINIPGAVAKTGKPRQIPMVSELATAIRNYLKIVKIESGYLFPSREDSSRPWRVEHVYAVYHGLIKRLGLDQRDEVGYMLHLHCLRKFFKTRLELAGVNRLLIMSWMGHDVGVQGVYFIPSPQDVKKEVEKAEKTLQIFGAETRESREKIEELLEDNRKHLETLWEALIRVVETVGEEKPELLKKFKEFGVAYGKRGAFQGAVIKPSLLKRSPKR